MANRRARLFILRWHRRLGVAAVLSVVVLVITGIALNHTSSWRLASTPLPSFAQSLFYGVKAPQITSFSVGEQWLSQQGSNLYLGSKSVAYCTGTFAGAAQFKSMIIAACASDILLLTKNGEVIERLGSAYGVPSNTVALSLTPDAALLRQESGEVISANLDELSFEIKSTTEIEWIKPRKPPADFLAALRGKSVLSDITWERFFQDLHSGRLFGSVGVFLVDAFALIFLFIALGGVWVWFTKPGRFGRGS